MQREYKVIYCNNTYLFYKYVNSRCSSHNVISPLIKDNTSYAFLDYNKPVLGFVEFTNDNGIITDNTLKTKNNINDIIHQINGLKKVMSTF